MAVMRKPQFIVDAKGRRRSVVLSFQDYERLLDRLEDLEDTLALDEAVRTEEEVYDYEEVRSELKKAGRL